VPTAERKRPPYKKSRAGGLQIKVEYLIPTVLAIITAVAVAYLGYETIRDKNLPLAEKVAGLMGITPETTREDFFVLAQIGAHNLDIPSGPIGVISGSRGPVNASLVSDGEPSYEYQPYQPILFDMVSHVSKTTIVSTERPNISITYVGSEDGASRFKENNEIVTKFFEGYVPPGCYIPFEFYIIGLQKGQDAGSIGFIKPEQYAESKLVAGTNFHTDKDGKLEQVDSFFALNKMYDRYDQRLGFGSEKAANALLANEGIHVIDACVSTKFDSEAKEDYSTAAEILALTGSKNYLKVLLGPEHEPFTKYLADEMEILANNK
jgi:hypothetical protein